MSAASLTSSNLSSPKILDEQSGQALTNIYDLNDDSLVEVFCHLPADEIVDRIAFVSKLWRKTAFQPVVWGAASPEKLKSRFQELNCRIIDQKMIKEELQKSLSPEMFLNLSFEGITSLDSHTALKIALFYKHSKNHFGTSSGAVNTEAGISLVSVPQGLTLNMLLAAYPNRLLVLGDILTNFGDIPIGTAHQLMITNDCLWGTVYKTYRTPKLSDCLNTLRVELPEIVGSAFYNLMTEVFFSTYPFAGGYPSKYMLCKEKLGEKEIAVGGFNSAPETLKLSCYQSSGWAISRKF